jgi:ubiquinone biosynthesis accessory factor UbiK
VSCERSAAFASQWKCIFCATNSHTANGVLVEPRVVVPHWDGADRRAFATSKGNAARVLVRDGAALYIRALPSRSGTVDPRFIDDLARRLSAAVPPGLMALRRDLEDNFKAVLQSGLARLDLVSRQEFDVQAAVLRRTREKLEALEARLAALEGGTERRPASSPAQPSDR